MLTCMSANFPIQFPSSMRGVWFRVLCGELHTRSTFRAADILSWYRDILYYYADRAWLLFLFSATSFSRLVLRLFVVIGIVYSFHE